MSIRVNLWLRPHYIKFTCLIIRNFDKLIDMLKKITMEDLGYDIFFESNRKKLGLDNFDVARVIVEHREAYKIKNANGEYLAKITG